jgi:tetratricopeptide (TPR) repeat protein
VTAAPGLAEAWLELAVVTYELGGYETALHALECYRQAAEVDETDAHYRAYRAGCEAKLGRPETALELLEGADETQPVTPYTRGLALLALDRIPEARHAFIQFAAMIPRLAQKRLEEIRKGVASEV